MMRGIAIAAAAIVLAGGTARAHEFMIRADGPAAQAGAPLGFSVLSSHVFIKSEEMEPPDQNRAGLFASGQRSDATLRPDQPTLSYRGSVRAPSGTFILWGTRAGQVWAVTADGLKEGNRRTPGATDSFVMEKFCKTLVNLSPDDPGFAAVTGDRLEIVPVSNPAKARPGEEMAVRVLYRGAPVAGETVTATYDGFSTEEDTYAYSTKAGKDGVAKVKITHPGLWMVRVQHSAPERTDDYDRYVARAVLMFQVP